MKKNKSMGSGCHNNIYNGGELAKECWSYKNADVVKKQKVSLHQYPPFNGKYSPYLYCYHQRGYVFLKEERKHD